MLGKKNFYKKPEEPIVSPKVVTPVITTSWDDGYILDLKIATLLKKYNMSGVFYIIVDMVGQPNYLGWNDIKALDGMGFEIGSHTITHPSDLKVLHDDALHYEIQNSKDMLEAVLNKQVTKFCYPRGRFDDRVRQVVADAGYLEARTTGIPGITESKDRYSLPGTIHIFQRKEYGDKSIENFARDVIDKARVEGGYVNIWGHSKEINENALWGVLETVLRYAKN